MIMYTRIPITKANFERQKEVINNSMKFGGK